MIAVALKGLLGRKTRAILTALAIVLGTGMVSATFIFTDTLNHAFNGVFSTPYEQASVVVSGKQIVTGAANTPSVPASLVARIQAVPGVEAEATVTTTGRTGVEMEALTAVSVALLTVYDMAKALDRGMEISDISLASKSGGVRGDFSRVDRPG